MPRLFLRLPFRIYGRAALAIAFLMMIIALLYDRATDNVRNMRERESEKIVDTAISLLGDLEARVAASEIARDAALSEGRELLSHVRFGSSGYLHVFDMEMITQVHPMMPDWIGTDQSDFEDMNGLRVFEEMRKLAVTSNKGASNTGSTSRARRNPRQSLNM